MNAQDHFTLVPQSPGELLWQWGVATWCFVAFAIGTYTMLAALVDSVAWVWRLTRLLWEY